YVRGYYTNWAQYRDGEGKFLPENIPNGLTHILYAFAK
nr:chitinase p69 {N-terminal} {EC 3.2.1.14} [Brugia pahangi, Peptide Partial, 37 aa] [Brugia pahangi]